MPGKPGLVEVDVPLGHVGSPPAAARLMYPYGETWLELATLNLTIDEAGGQDDAVAQPCGSAPPAPAAAPPAAPNPLPIPLPIPLPLGPIGGLGLGAPAPAPVASPAPGLTLFGITLLGPAPAQPKTSTGLLDQVFHLLW